MNFLSAKNNDTNDKDKIIEMGNKNKKKKMNNFTQNNCSPAQPQSVTESNSEKNEWIRTILTIVASSAMTLLIQWLVWGRSVDTSLAKLEEIPGQVVDINTRLARLEGENDAKKSAKTINANKELVAVLPKIEKNTVSVTIPSACSANDILGTDIDGNEVKARDYVNEPILLTYTEDDKEVFFLGQFNEIYHWNGYCVTNAYYSDGTLFGICESNFKDGKRLDFKSFVQDGEDNTWVYSDRRCEEGYNTGCNKTYQYITSDVKNFTETNVRTSDILYVDKYLEKHDMVLQEEYIGLTSDGKYNDATGNAYYISYYEDGSVKTLYQGKEMDGEFMDDSGNGWYITCDRDNNAPYMYYQGKFNVVPTEERTNENTKHGLKEEQIKSILKEKDCKLELKWDKQSLELVE